MMRVVRIIPHRIVHHNNALGKNAAFGPGSKQFLDREIQSDFFLGKYIQFYKSASDDSTAKNHQFLDS